MLKEVGEVETIPETKHIEWRLPIFFARENENPYFFHRRSFFYESPSFSAIDHSWKMELRSCYDEFIYVDICNKSGKGEYQIECSFGLKKYDGIIEKRGSRIVKSDSTYCRSISLIAKAELLRRKTELAPSNTLTVTCSLKRMPEIPDFIEPADLDETKPLKLIKLDKLSANFKDLYADKETCDVTLKVQDQEFKAHSQVLMARSSVFFAAFKHDTLENQTGVITIPDCDPESFQVFLEYLYSGEMKELSLNNALNLYYTSDKYNIEEVKLFCIDYLTQSLSVESICEIAEFADKYDKVTLFSKVQDFFNKNFIKILLTSGWESLTRKDYRLPNKLLVEMAKTKIEK